MSIKMFLINGVEYHYDHNELENIPEINGVLLKGKLTTEELGIKDGKEGPQGEPGAPGADGYSPTVTVADITDGHHVTITDANGAHSFDVMDGEVSQAEFDELSDDVADLKSAFVTPEMFGAKGDGVTDDTAAIQTAFNTAKPVYFANKTYCVSTSLVYRGTRLCGSGTIKSTAAFQMVLQCVSSSVEIDGIKVDCNGMSACGIYCYNNNAGSVVVKNCEVFGTENDGLESISTCVGVFLTGFLNNTVDSCYIHGINRTKKSPGSASSIGIYVQTDGNALIQNNRIVGVACSTETTDCDGIYVTYKTGPQDATNVARISTNTIIDTTGRFIKTQCRQALITNNRCSLINSASGLYIKAFDFQTGGGVCQGNIVNYGDKAGASSIFVHADYNVNVQRNITILGNTFLSANEVSAIFYGNGNGIGGELNILNNICVSDRFIDHFVRLAVSTEIAHIRLEGNKVNIYRVVDLLSSTDLSSVYLYVIGNVSTYTNNAIFNKAVTINNLVISQNIGIVDQVTNATMDFSQMKAFEVFYRGSTPIANLPTSITDGNNVYLRRCGSGLVQYYETAHGRSGIIQA